jgi:hypothetical protein
VTSDGMARTDQASRLRVRRLWGSGCSSIVGGRKGDALKGLVITGIHTQQPLSQSVDSTESTAHSGDSGHI